MLRKKGLGLQTVLFMIQAMENYLPSLSSRKAGENMTKALMVVLAIIMLTGSVSAQETPCACEIKQEVKVVRGARGPVGPVGPQGLPGKAVEVPEWYLWLSGAGLLFGLLGTGLAFGALVRAPQVAQPVNVINIPGPNGNQNP